MSHIETPSNPADSLPSDSPKVVTPLMQQYLSVKLKYPDEILFFRLGDFYEMFYEDAQRAAPILEVALTARQAVPMCGIPHHAATSYISKLLKAGLSVAMAEQLEDPKKTKGMVKRDVVRVITPGTIVEDELLPGKANNFLVSIAVLKGEKGQVRWALAAADVSTGRQWVLEEPSDMAFNSLKSHLVSLAPSEVLLLGEAASFISPILDKKAVVRFEPVPAQTPRLIEQALAGIKNYLARDNASALASLQSPEVLPSESTGILFLDETAVRHLELVASSDPLHSSPTLLSVIDRTVTSLGSRLIRWWLLHPSRKRDVIEDRLNQVEELIESPSMREELRQTLKEVADIERICVRVQGGSASPRDLASLRMSISRFPQIQKILQRATSQGGAQYFQKNILALQIPQELSALLENQLTDEPPAKLSDGGVIRDGFYPELDELRELRRNGKKWIAALEASERDRTGIGSMKIGFNDVFGYYLEVSKTNINKVPSDWIRKQTLTNGERYVTPALKEQEEKILGAEDKILALETRLYAELVHQVAAFAPSIQKSAQGIAHIDAIASLSQAALEHHFVRPDINDSNHLNIKNGRHPVIEKHIGRDRFIANDLVMDDERRISLITGPNMAGKSTYLRQAALIVILAQMGSFVPVESAQIGLVDKIFTRIGASDRLAQGQSTFMVEMQEVATLMKHATSRSLLILDEVGRGTSTYDGVSIAWAVVEYLSKLTPRALFATHYFELTQLEGLLPGVFNSHATAKEWPGADGRRQVVFLYQILNGAADRSYGIHVAEMAGIPSDCTKRARDILKELEVGRKDSATKKLTSSIEQLEFFGGHPVVEDLKNINANNLTPLEALNKLSELIRKVQE